MFKIQTRPDRKPIVVYTREDARQKADQWHRYASDLRIRFYKPIYERENFAEEVDTFLTIFLNVFGIALSVYLFIHGRR